MIYCLAELRNYRQLTRLRAASLPAIESGFLGIMESRKAQIAPVGQGSWLVELGPDDDLDAGGAAAALLRAQDFLEARRQELFGFTLLVVGLEKAQAAPTAELMRGMLQEADRLKACFWPRSARLFEDFLAFERVPPLYRVTGPIQAPEAELDVSEEPRPWIREALVGRALDIISDRLNTEDPAGYFTCMARRASARQRSCVRPRGASSAAAVRSPSFARTRFSSAGRPSTRS